MIATICSFGNGFLPQKQGKFDFAYSANGERLGTTPIPDFFFDKIAPHLAGAEVKVILYVFRRTFGFNKLCDHISYSQFLG